MAAARLRTTMARRTLLALLALVPLLLTACDPESETASGASPTPGATSTDTSTQAPEGPDPLVPYSPSPSELVPRTTGFVTETLTLPTAGGATMLVSVDSTAIEREFTGSYRAMSVWATFENPGDEPWTGVPAASAKIADELGAVFEPIADPPASDLHPKPERYDASNRDLTRRVTIGPGERLQGVIVFHPTGGNRFITISISMNAGGVWGEWATTMGPF